MLRRTAALFLVIAAWVGTVGAQEAPLRLSDGDTVREVLTRYVGKGVTVKLDSGEELAGKVQTVGEHLVHLSELAGKEFYDAVIDLDEIAAVIVRVRER